MTCADSYGDATRARSLLISAGGVIRPVDGIAVVQPLG